MSLLLTTTSLLLLGAAPTTAPASAPRDFLLHEGLPSAFKVDGKLDEWTSAPSVTLGADNQVAGSAKVSSPQDFSGKVWVALGREGLAVAGEILDDRVLLSKTPEQVNLDHVEVWLALPQPELPPLAFVNQFGEHTVPTAETCGDTEVVTEGSPEACRAWWKAQTERRKKLVRPFLAQYGLMSGPLVRFGQKGSVGTVRYEPMAGGYRFEALIPASAFPRSAEAPLRSLRVLVDVVDADEGKGKLETFLSSSKTRRFGDPSTFHAVTLARPVSWGAWPDLFERALKANERGSYQPSPDVQTFAVWLNPAVGYQYAPNQPSPVEVGVDLSRQESQAALEDIEVLSVPARVDVTGGVGFWTVSRRDQALLDTRDSGTRVLMHTQRPPGLHLLEVTEGMQSLLGTGTCGACPQVTFTLVKMDAQGRFSAPEELEGAFSQGEAVAWEATPDLSRIEAFVTWTEGQPRQLAVRHTWNPKTQRYDTQRFARPENTGE
ncbi:hypothetical protein [Archangium primigenium]|uniref:hypothetical protein n=1 Tax=[Archangium] primigenium TaxID=2792470 RepID=UPI00195B4951|nr:hypothetical protein [Archangium primigenium]MBM7112781.1 hypothetical protein [Archangium primigenium]